MLPATWVPAGGGATCGPPACAWRSCWRKSRKIASWVSLVPSMSLRNACRPASFLETCRRVTGRARPRRTSPPRARTCPKLRCKQPRGCFASPPGPRPLAPRCRLPASGRPCPGRPPPTRALRTYKAGRAPQPPVTDGPPPPEHPCPPIPTPAVVRCPCSLQRRWPQPFCTAGFPCPCAAAGPPARRLPEVPPRQV